jgi:hypothetical protein
MLKIYIDVQNIAKEFKELKEEVERDLNQGVARLAASIHAKVLEDSQQELHSTREIYAKALNRVEEISPGVYIIALEEAAMWIEEGIKAGMDMKKGLLKNPKMYPSGKKYKVVPFEYSKTPSSMTGYAQQVSSKIQQHLRRRNVPYKGIEYGPNGSPRVGRLHEFDFGGPKPGKGNTPVMKGVNIYQSAEGGNVRRDVLTFRTVTEDQEGKWIHPGLTKKNFFERAQTWGINEWEQTMLPAILEKYR